jgi:subtilisin family serine protease
MIRVTFTLLVSVWIGGCVSAAGTLPVAGLPDQARSEPDRYVLVTVRNVAAPIASRAGSTPRGYDAAAAYSVSGAAHAAARAISADYGLQQVAAWPIATLHVHCLVYRVPDGQTRDALLAKLAADPRVELAQPLQHFTTSAGAYNDRYVSLQRSFDEMSIAAAHQWSQGAGVTVAVIDTDIDDRHPDLAGRVSVRRNFLGSRPSRFDHSRHGTEIAGVIAAVGNNGQGIVGVAPAVELLALRACWQVSGDSGAAVCNSFTLAQAMAAAIDARADVINLSLVGPADPLLAALTARATTLGSIVVGAMPASGLVEGFPAGAPGVLPVEMAEHALGAPTVLRAPGKEILTLAPAGGYDFATGSSLAVANVSGIVALLRARRHLTSVAAHALLAESTRDVATAVS